MGACADFRHWLFVDGKNLPIDMGPSAVLLLIAMGYVAQVGDRPDRFWDLAWAAVLGLTVVGVHSLRGVWRIQGGVR